MNTRLERFAGDKHSSLLGPFVSNKENKVNMGPRAQFTTLHFLLNLRKGPISHTVTTLKRLSSDKHSSLLGPFVSYKK